LPALVGGLAIALTAGLWRHEQQSQQRDLRSNFEFALRQMSTRIEQRMASYEQMLRGVRGLFDASDEVTRQDFDTYVELLQSGADFAGLRALAYAPLHAAGGPAGPDDSLPAATAPTTFLAPAGGTPAMPLGADLLADPGQRAAMLQARDAGTAVLAPALRATVRDGGTAPKAADSADSADASLLMFLPLYAKGRQPESIQTRRRQLTGWVVASFRLEDLMSSLYGEGMPGLDLRIHDGASITDATRLYPPEVAPHSPQPPRFDAQEYIGFAGHTWTLWARSTPVFEQQYSNDSAQIIAIAGSGFSVVLALLTWLLVTGRDRAHDTAQAMTRQLRDSERQYRRIVETASEGIWMVDAAGQTSFVNPALQLLLGYSADELLGRPWTDFMPASAVGPDDEPAVPPQDTGALHDIRLRRSDGSDLWARLSTSAIVDEQGRSAGVLAMVTDVSAHHQAESRRAVLEAQLRQAQKMEAIGTLAGGIAHDFNNILASILGNVALVRQDLGDGHPSLARLEQISQAGTRARSLVQQIVAFSRQQPQQRVAQPLRPLLEETVDLLRSTLPARVELVLQLADTPLPVAADATQLQQVLMNLCTNAWHALPGGAGRIVIGLAAETLDAVAASALGDLAAGAYAHVWVADNGSGMDEAVRQRIFEPFFTTKPVGQGTGLGLAVVHGIVASHGGSITVHSTPGQGSSFDMYFPLVPLPIGAPAGGQPAPAVPRGRGEHVLYVDDDPVMVLMVQALLQRLGYRVTCLQDPRQALARAEAGDDPIDLVVTDFNMPELSGLDLALRLAQSRPALPVVVSSGHVTDGLRADAQRAGVRQVLQKEYTLEQLGTLVHQVLAAGPSTASGPGPEVAADAAGAAG